MNIEPESTTPTPPEPVTWVPEGPEPQPPAEGWGLPDAPHSHEDTLGEGWGVYAPEPDR